MGRKGAPQPLALSDVDANIADVRQSRPGETVSLEGANSTTTKSRSPRSPFTSRFSTKKSQSVSAATSPAFVHIAELANRPSQQAQQFPSMTSAIHQSVEQPAHEQQQQQSQAQWPQPQPYLGHQRSETEKPAKSGFFFGFNKPTKSTELLQKHHQYSDSAGEIMSRGSEAMVVPQSKQSDVHPMDFPSQRPQHSMPSRSDVSLASSNDPEHTSSTNASTNTSKRSNKSRPFNLLNRKMSNRTESENSTTQAHDGSSITGAESGSPPMQAPLKTAPAQSDRAFRDMMSSSLRNHSADRAKPRDGSTNREGGDREHARSQTSSSREHGFLSGLKNSRAAESISNRLFGRSGRNASESHVEDDKYILKVINLPLVEQTRMTRISKRLEDSRDKTEFWMPAFPWRAIDYLNYKGCDVEGLYRIPGSGPQIRKWQRKFDEEYDVDLFDQSDLYDINIVGSMLKAWLRELPDELFPKASQERIARECAGADTVPPLLIEELSNLSPFNYYLLFAITCHLSLLLAHSDKNKMDFRNLCICFQPCIKIDAFCFRFLVCEWRDCWKGCKNEAKYIEEEYQLFSQPPPPGVRNMQQIEQQQVAQEREASAERNKQSPTPRAESKDRAKKTRSPTPTQSKENGVAPPAHPSSAPPPPPVATEQQPQQSTQQQQHVLPQMTLQVQPDQANTKDLRPLSPIKPLSPLGF